MSHVDRSRGTSDPGPGGSIGVELDDVLRMRAAERLVPPQSANDTLATLSGLASRLLGTGHAQISLITDVQWVAAGSGLDPASVGVPTPRNESLCTVALQRSAPLAVGDAVADDRVRHLPPVTSGAVGSYLGVPLHDNGGQLVGALCAYDGGTRSWGRNDVVVLEDLGQAVVAELERIALAEEHETIRVRLDLAMDAAGVGSWDWDPRTGELAWDDRLGEVFGFAPDEFDGTIRAGARRVHPDDRQRVADALDAVVHSGTDYDETYRVVRPDASVRWVSARGRGLRGEDGSVVRVIGAASDITDQHLAQQETETMLSLLELVAQAGRVLADSLEVEDAIRSLAQIVVPALADWSIVTLVAPDGTLRDVESWHRDPALRPAVAQLAAHRLEGQPFAGALGDALASGEAVFVDSGGYPRAERLLVSELAKQAIRQLRHESHAVFPLLVGDSVVGMLTLARGPERPPIGGGEAAAATEIAECAGTALHHARSFRRVRDFSEDLQRTMLTDPVQPDGYEIAVRYTPASQAAQVGGDWYDSFVQRDGAVTLVVGDVIGHDSAAAAAMGQLRALTRGIAYATDASPASVLTRVGQAIEGLELDTIATVIVAQLTRDGAGRSRMRWANGGHPPALLLRPGGDTVLLAGHDLLLGLSEDDARTEHEVELEPGSVLMLYTDGLVERRTENLSDGLARLVSVVHDGRHLSLTDLVDHVHRELVPTEPEDDVAVLAVAVS